MSTTEEQLEVIERSGGSAGYVVQGRSVIASITINGVTGMGVAKCMPKDRFDENIGLGIATGRAFADIGFWISEQYEAKSVTQKAWDKQNRKAK